MSELTVKPLADSQYQDIFLPGHLNKNQFNFTRSIKFILPNKLRIFLVPPIEVFNDKKSDRSWLLLREDNLKIYRSQEIILLPEKNRTKYRMMIVRKSGRLVATGELNFLSNGDIKFEVRFPLTRTGKETQLANGIVKSNVWDSIN